MADGAIAAEAGETELVYGSDDGPGLKRRRAGRGFAFVDASGKPLKDAETLARLRKLAIPPAWTEVWINPDPNGHLQATGRDVKGRKQYRYHDAWSARRSQDKFARMAAFGRALPKVREQVEHDLGRRGLSREKVLATVVRLLEITLIRVGNKEYAKQNKHYGLTTLTKRHVDVDGAELCFAFKGKSGVVHRLSVRDRRLARILKSIEDLPGQHLFKYRNDDGELVGIESSDVNAYIRQVAGQDFSAKDFRTWAGTISAARTLCQETEPASATASKRTIAQCAKAVAGLLGNTPAVCRSSYIHPRVMEAYAEGALTGEFPEPEDAAFETALIAFLDDEADETAKSSKESPQTASAEP